MKRYKLMAIVMLVALLAAFAAMPSTSVFAKKSGSPLSVPVSGTVTDPVTGATGPFTGTFTVTKFVPQDGGVAAKGILTGSLVNPATGAVTQVSKTVTWAVAAIDPTCTILTLTLGPLDLTLLGLNVHLDTVHLVITGTQGTLLGGLLCGLANLLSGNTLSSVLNQVVALLNQILAAL